MSEQNEVRKNGAVSASERSVHAALALANFASGVPGQVAEALDPVSREVVPVVCKRVGVWVPQVATEALDIASEDDPQLHQSEFTYE